MGSVHTELVDCKETAGTCFNLQTIEINTIPNIIEGCYDAEPKETRTFLSIFWGIDEQRQSVGQLPTKDNSLINPY